MLNATGQILHLILSVNFILTVITASTPLLLAASGELVVERAGVLNLGLEGMMIMGAACGFAGAYASGSVFVGALCGVVAGMAMAAVFGFLTLGLAVNQVATGLALTILGAGLSGLIGSGFVGERITPAPQLYLPVLTDLPVIGRILFGQDAFVYFSIAYDRGTRLDRASPGGVRLVAAGTPGGWRVSVRRRHFSAAFGARARSWHTATDVFVALSCNRRRTGIDFTYARYRRVCRARITWRGLCAGPLNSSLHARATGVRL
jgi:hypothetical protein